LQLRPRATVGEKLQLSEGPLPINWSLPDRPLWGAQAKQMDRDFYNYSFAVGTVLHDMPQHEKPRGA
jgi:hypothetical protein